MENGIGCLLWVIRGIAWIILGIATYNWMDPNTFWDVIIWLIIWNIVTGIVSWLLFGLMVALIAFFE